MRSQTEILPTTSLPTRRQAKIIFLLFQRWSSERAREQPLGADVGAGARGTRHKTIFGGRARESPYRGNGKSARVECIYSRDAGKGARNGPRRGRADRER